MSYIPTPEPSASVRDELLRLIAQQANEIETQQERLIDLGERLSLYERRLDALAAYFREAAYVL